MDPERFRQVERLYHAALDREESKRSAFLEEACARDLSLRREVESLLGHNAAASPLDYPAIDAAAKALAQDESHRRRTELADQQRVGSTISHYRILEELGRGGMGIVYKAEDMKLGRFVALKFLPAHLADDHAVLERFQREARAVAALSHPNVVTLYSVEECDGVHFLTMELIGGQPLDRLISASGLPVERIVEIGGALSEALAAAHEKGILHRDLKPANVMVTGDGRVKVLDFGLAKEIRPAIHDEARGTLAGHTQAGMVMGTPAYMSPEQLSGRVLDHRTDIFSLGVVLYEMATGRRPFQGSSTAELVSSILRDSPPLVTDVRSDLPNGLARLIGRCLEKDAHSRLQSARDVSNEFRVLARLATSTAPAPTSAGPAVTAPDSRAARAEEGFWVAVLPFKYKGSEPGLDALAEGITEAVVTGLSRFSYLRVIARGSTAKSSSDSGDVHAIGKEMGARYVMAGSIRQAGSTAHLAVQLVDAATGAHLWAETFDRAFRAEEIFALQDELVPRIVSTVADTYGVLPHNMSEALRNRNPEQLTPYEAVLRSFAHFPRLSAEEHAASRAGLEYAVEQAPGYADAWAMLSMLYREEYAHRLNVRPDPVGRALAAAQRAVEAAPSNHLAYHALASAQFFRRELRAFRNSAERAIGLNNMDGFTLAYLGFLIAYSGDWERGCLLVERARRLNPYHPGWYWVPSFFDAYRKRDYRAALDFALKVNMPGFWRTNFALATAYGQLGEREAAHNALRELLALRPDFATAAREELAKWWDPELVEHLIEGLSKAGLEIAGERENSQACSRHDNVKTL